MKQLKAMKLSWMITFMCQVYKDNEDKALSKICLEKQFERGRAGKGVC
jgi:hypothetical protein